MKATLTDRLVATGVFVYAFVLYFLTMAKTTSFWDSGEFIASVYGLQVMHPPGAPFYLLVGRLFTFAAPLFSGLTPEPVAYTVNLVSVFATAFTVLLTHLIIVQLVRLWQTREATLAGEVPTWTSAQRLSANVAGVVGALTFAATDSNWFNAVEAEVYAPSILFTALVVWLALRWHEATVAEEAEIRARGEHPFGLHADRYLLLIAYLFGLAIGVHLLNLLAVFFVAVIVYFTKFDRADLTTAQRTKGLLLTGVVGSAVFLAIYPGIIQTLPTIAEVTGAPVLVFVAVIAACAGSVWYTQRRRMPVGNLLALGATLVVIGYSTYGIIPLRSATNPPIDLNDPDTIEDFVSYLKREQYGSTPLLRGASFDARVVRNPRTGEPEYEERLFPRRHSPDPSHVRVYQQYNSDLDFFVRYQLGHMYWRYFMWQFAGRAGDHQDAGWISGFRGKGDLTGLTPSEVASRNAYFLLPLLLGLFGMAWHFMRDWRRALAVLALFFITGVGIILYLNQTPNQPRERDYSYVGSFFAFSLWIGIGAAGLIELTREALARQAEALRRTATLALAAVLFLAVPGWMAYENYDDHDRTGNIVASDFAYNLLNSTAPNAILFTNGDNDTYPLWYLQFVMGVRPDVRVVNLSLLNTPWYIKQIKNQRDLESDPVPMTLTDAQVDALRPATDFQPTDLQLPPPPGATVPWAGGAPAEPMTWRLNGRPFGQDRSLLYVADLAVLDILRAVAEGGWERPVYFASTVGPDSELDLQPFLQNEGLARRVVPVRRSTPRGDGAVVPEIALERVRGFRIQNLADPRVYLNENERNMSDSYRRTLGLIATELAAQGYQAEARALLERLEVEVPFATIPAGFGSLYTLAEAYTQLGDRDRMVATLRRAEDLALRQYQTARSAPAQERALQYIQFVQGAYLMGSAYEEAAAFTARLADALGAPQLRQTPDEMRAQGEAMRRSANLDTLTAEDAFADGPAGG
ncbi:MAG: DUF2723 domain-containing protein [Rubricoccaceae bacterium]